MERKEGLCLHRAHLSRISLLRAYPAVGPTSSPVLPLAQVRPGSESKHTIDYIWHTEGDFTTTAVLSLPDEAVMPDSRLPCWQHPSDHLSLVAKLQLLQRSTVKD